MKLLFTFVAVLFVSGQSSATLVTKECLNGETNPEICCQNILETQDVLLRNPNNCNTYYQCIHQQPLLRPCPSDLHWSVEANRCEWPELAGCGSNNNPTEIPSVTPECMKEPSEECLSGLSDPEICCENYPNWMNIFLTIIGDCHSYYVCKDKKPFIQHCQEGLKYNSQTKRCEWITNDECGLLSTTELPAGESTTKKSCISTDPELPPDNCLNGELDPENCCKGVPYWQDILLKNPEDCGLYYQCVHEKPMLRPCPTGLHWSVSAKRCDWPEIAGCQETTTSNNPTKTTYASQSTTKSPNPTTQVPHSTTNYPTGTTCKPTKPPNNDCLKGVISAQFCCEGVPYWEDILLRNPDDCSTYYQCVHENPVLRPCPAGLHWSVSANRCEWPEIAECEELGTTGNPKPTTKSPNPTTAVPHPTTNSPTGTCKPTTSPNDDCLNGVISSENCCKGVPHWEDVLIKNPEDCETYYQCVHEKPVLRPCPAGLHWSVFANRCEWPEIAGCKGSGTTGNPKSTTSAPQSTTKSPNPTTSVPHPTTNIPTGTTCKPTTSPNDDCLNGVISPEICCKGIPYWEDVLITNPKDCGTYYQCVHEKPVLRPCPAGLHWSVSANRCEWPEIAGCEVSETTGNLNPTTSAPQSTTKSPNPTTSVPHATTNSLPGTTCKPTTSPNDDCLNGVISPEICCKGVPYWEDVLVRNPEDCGTYYQCVYEKPVHRPCPAGLHWSVSANRCEWPEIAGCEVSQTTGKSNPTTSAPQATTQSPNPTTSLTHPTTDSPPGTTCKPTISPNDDCLNGVIHPEICCKGEPYWVDVLIRNPEDCGTYYQCVHEKPVLRPCPAGLHWSVSANRCEWPEIAGCKGSRTTGNSKPTTSAPQSTTDLSNLTPSGPNPTTNSPSSTTCKSTTPSNDDCLHGVIDPEICCKEVPYWENVLIKNLEDCGTYYQCVHEKPVLRPCPAGLHWSVSANRCEWPDIAGCEELGTTNNKKPTTFSPQSTTESPNPTTSVPHPTTGTTGNPNPTPSPESSTTTPHPTISGALSTCKPTNPEKPTNSCVNGVTNPILCCQGVPYWVDVLLRNPTDCGTYYQCVHGEPVLRPCPAGLHWSVSAYRCEWPDIAGCKAVNQMPTDNPSEPTILPRSTTNNSVELGSPSNEGCLEGLVKPDKCCEGVSSKVDVLFRNTKDCGTYYQCLHEKPMLRFCPDGLHFSVELHRCEWKNNVNCKESL